VSGPALNGIEGVVIGASAGGVQALSELLPAFPQGTAAAIFVCCTCHATGPAF